MGEGEGRMRIAERRREFEQKATKGTKRKEVRGRRVFEPPASLEATEFAEKKGTEIA